jgi:hypothetical protein
MLKLMMQFAAEADKPDPALTAATAAPSLYRSAGGEQ